MYTHQAGRKPAQQQNWQSYKNHTILRKNTIFNEHPVPAGEAKISGHAVYSIHISHSQIILIISTWKYLQIIINYTV